jgi:phosphotransferase system HPr (HPr) family protein
LYLKNAEIRYALGSDPKPASDFVRAAKKYRSDIYIIDKEVQINAKSILGLLASAIRAGSRFALSGRARRNRSCNYFLCELIEK